MNHVRRHSRPQIYVGYSEAAYQRRAAVQRRRDIVGGILLGGIFLITLALVIMALRGPR